MCLIQLPKQVLLLRARTLMVEHYIGLPYANSSGVLGMVHIPKQELYITFGLLLTLSNFLKLYLLLKSPDATMYKQVKAQIIIIIWN